MKPEQLEIHLNRVLSSSVFGSDISQSKVSLQLLFQLSVLNFYNNQYDSSKFSLYKAMMQVSQDTD